ncbi:MAG: toll/interleukin-1 receptor domain-containing protein [Lachnospiraceae bacterium]|nr:toll/interleukin-1 receptor domain-containing protein [Lachnospiraceae bacterium]
MRKKTTELKYKTRGNVSPGRKQNVYFCCYDDDFQVYFEKISNNILKHSDCAIWYKDPDSAYGFQDIVPYLDSMRFFVVPITREFLLNENSARCDELKYAIDNNITVLALMEQDGLEVIFDETCGHIQSLNQVHDDENSKQIFDEKLNQFLNSMIIGTDEQERIREELTASIFISYRKKDREQVNQLIDDLHQNETLRDVGIWYDEYLVPGEDFDEAIESAIKNSELFLMVITPNMMEKGNYVRQNEYPLAKREEKSIIPVHFISVKDHELNQCFDGIPESVNARPREAVDKRIQDELQDVLKNDDSPQHLYYVGLAYLTGIHKKKDKERGYELIRQAADSNYLIAEERLGRMYEYGDGVESDEILATFWYEKYFAHVMKTIPYIDDGEIIVTVLNQMSHVDTIYRDLEMEKKVISTKERIVSIAREFQKRTKDPQFQRIELLESLRLVKVYLENDQLAEAEKLLFGFDEIINDIVNSSYRSKKLNVNDFLNFGEWMEAYGILFYKKGRNDSSKHYFYKSIGARQSNEAVNSVIMNRQSLWEDYMYLTKIHISVNELAEARQTIDKALAYITSVADECKDDSNHIKVVDTYVLYGDLELSSKNTDAALQKYDKALDQLREIISRHKKLKFSQYKNCATIYEKIGTLDASRKELLYDALDLWRYLSRQFPGKEEYKLHMQTIEKQLGG